jgi:FdhD protein
VTGPRAVTALRAIKVRPEHHAELPEQVATEEPMQIRVSGPGQPSVPLVVTMRTPGHDFELAAGFVLTEAVADRHEIARVDYCAVAELSDVAARYNHVTVHLTRRWEQAGPDRHFAASSSCGTCGKTSIDQIEVRCAPLGRSAPFPGHLVPSLPDRLRQAQKAFDRTGGLHAAGLFDRSGNLLYAREDVGRHNAVDKVVGATILSPDGVLPGDCVLAVSGRVSFEIVQKAAAAGLPVIVAVSAPSSLAVSAATRLGVTIAAFVRAGSYNLYSHPERIDLGGPP